MQAYWTQPGTYDPIAFDQRFRAERLDLWIPHFVRLGAIAPQQQVLDIGCGTGGFAMALAERTQANVIGVDIATQLLVHGRSRAHPWPVRWVLGAVEALPIVDGCVDVVIMSLILHQCVDRPQAIREVYRVLRPGGRLVVRTVLPEVALSEWIPFRFFPKVAALEASRMPALDDMLTMYRQAGFTEVHTSTVCANTSIDFHQLAEELRQRTRPSYHLLTDEELAEGIHQIEQEWVVKGGLWIEPKPHLFMTGIK